MDKITELMAEHKMKNSKVEHLDEVCDGCGKELKRVTITFEDDSQKVNETGCMCEINKQVNKKQREIDASAFDRASVIHGDYENKAFGDFMPATESQKQAVKTVKGYVEHFDDMLSNAHSLLMQGTFGTGKTHLAAAARNALSKRHYKVLFISLPDYLDKLKQEFSDKKAGNYMYHSFYKFAVDAELLVLDDVGANRMSDWEVSELFRLVDARRNKCTIYTTNLSSKQLRSTQQLYRIFSRMMEKSKPIVIEGKDHRMKGLI